MLKKFGIPSLLVEQAPSQTNCFIETEEKCDCSETEYIFIPHVKPKIPTIKACFADTEVPTGQVYVNPVCIGQGSHCLPHRKTAQATQNRPGLDSQPLPDTNQ